MRSFKKVYAMAAKRKGGEQELKSLLPPVVSRRQLLKKSDARYLSIMSQCIFHAGFNWSVVDKKWPDFEVAFHGFEPEKLIHLSPEQWEAYTQDARIVRNWQKIKAVWQNAELVLDIAKEHGRFSKFIADWPVDDLIGLWAFLKKRGSRLGGQTRQWFLRFSGKDGFILTQDVIQALQNSGVDIRDNPSTQAELRAIQDAFNAWHLETELPYSHLSKIAAYSIGRNYDNENIRLEMQKMAQAV